MNRHSPTRLFSLSNSLRVMLSYIFRFLMLSVAVCSLVEGQETGLVVDRAFGAFDNAVSLSVNASGNVLVLDAGKNALLEYSPKGELVRSIGGRGWGDLEFDAPTDVCANFILDIYIADYNNRRIQRFDRKMNLVQSIMKENSTPSLNGAFYPRACALSSQGELFVVESDGRRILKFTPNQQLEKEFGSFNAGAGVLRDPRDIAVTPEGKVYVLDDHRVVEYDTFTNFITSVQLDSDFVPTSISVGGGGMFVTDPHRIVVYTSTGMRQGEITSGALVGVESKGEFRDAATSGSTLYILTPHTLFVAQLRTE